MENTECGVRCVASWTSFTSGLSGWRQKVNFKDKRLWTPDMKNGGAWRARHLLWVLPYVIRHIRGETSLGFPWDVFSPKINKYLSTWTRGTCFLWLHPLQCLQSLNSVFHSAPIASPTTVNFTQNPTGLLWVHADVHADPNLRGCPRLDSSSLVSYRRQAVAALPCVLVQHLFDLGHS